MKDIMEIKDRINGIIDFAAKWVFGIPQDQPLAEKKEDRSKQINWPIAKKRIALLVGIVIVISLPKACNDVDATRAAEQMLTDTLTNPRSLDVDKKKVIWSGKNSAGKRAYIVKIEYTAQNGFGNRIPGCIYSAFWFDDDKNFSWKTNFNVMKCDNNVGRFMGVDVDESKFVEMTVSANNFH